MTEDATNRFRKLAEECRDLAAKALTLQLPFMSGSEPWVTMYFGDRGRGGSALIEEMLSTVGGVASRISKRAYHRWFREQRVGE